MYHPKLAIARTGPIAVVTFDRPEQRTPSTCRCGAACAPRWKRCPPTMTCAASCCAGAGTEAFSAGADIAAFAEERGYARARYRTRRLCCDGGHAVDPPVPPSGGGDDHGLVPGRAGAGIATMCDFRVGGEGTGSASPPGIRFLTTRMPRSIRSSQMVWYRRRRRNLDRGPHLHRPRGVREGHPVVASLPGCPTVEAEALALAGRIASRAARTAPSHKAALRNLRGTLPVTPAEEAASSDFTEQPRISATPAVPSWPAAPSVPGPLNPERKAPTESPNGKPSFIHAPVGIGADVAPPPPDPAAGPALPPDHVPGSWRRGAVHHALSRQEPRAPCRAPRHGAWWCPTQAAGVASTSCPGATCARCAIPPCTTAAERTAAALPASPLVDPRCGPAGGGRRLAGPAARQAAESALEADRRDRLLTDFLLLMLVVSRSDQARRSAEPAPASFRTLVGAHGRR